MKIGFIGLGQMAFAMIKSIQKSNYVIASNRSETRLDFAKRNTNIEVTRDNKEVIKKSKVVFLCVKPQDMEDLLEEIKDSGDQLFVSVAAGITLSYLESKLKKVVRVMPNTSCLVGEMTGGYSIGSKVSKEESKIVHKLLNSMGKVYLLKEKDLDIVTALSGSGQGFITEFLESMVAASVEEGLDEQIAKKLAYHTAMGTGKLLLESNISSDELLKMVTSPKGTTAEGLKVLEENKFKSIVKEAIRAATKRSRELGK